MITDEQKKQFQVKLEQELAAMEKEIDSFTKEFSATPGGHEAYVENSGEISQEDEAQVSEEYGRRKALESVMENRLGEIRAALERINTAGYGICSQCHAQIPTERMMVNPAANTCIQCAK